MKELAILYDKSKLDFSPLSHLPGLCLTYLNANSSKWENILLKSSKYVWSCVHLYKL